MGRFKLGAGLMPRAPFVDKDLCSVLSVVFAHYPPVPFYISFNFVGFAKQLVILLRVEIYGVALARVPVRRSTAGNIPRIMVYAPAVEPSLKKPFALFADVGKKLIAQTFPF